MRMKTLIIVRVLELVNPPIRFGRRLRRRRRCLHRRHRHRHRRCIRHGLEMTHGGRQTTLEMLATRRQVNIRFIRTRGSSPRAAAAAEAAATAAAAAT